MNLYLDCVSTPWKIIHCDLNTRVSVTRKSVYCMGPNSIPGQRWPGNWSAISRLDKQWGQIDQTLGHILRQVDWFPGHRWPGMEFGPNGPFPGQVLTLVFSECRDVTHYFFLCSNGERRVGVRRLWICCIHHQYILVFWYEFAPDFHSQFFEKGWQSHLYHGKRKNKTHIR